LVTAVHFAEPDPFPSKFWLDLSSDDPGTGPAPDQPQHDRLRSFARERGDRRSGPIWLTFAAAHLVADRRGTAADWQSLAWLRGTEIATDALWSASPAVSRPGAKLGLRLAGAANVAMAVGFAWMARR
jgi:hypothetical protein